MKAGEFELLQEFSPRFSECMSYVTVRLHARGGPSDAFLSTLIGMHLDGIRCLLETYAKEWARDTDNIRMLTDYHRWASQSHFIKA